MRLELQSGGCLTVDQVLVAAGRVANVARLAIERAGLTVNKRGLLAVNERYQTDRVDYCVGRGFYRTNPRGQIAGDLSGEIKLVFRYPDKRLPGVHIIGEIAAELVHIGLIALQTECTIDTFIDTVFNYPCLGDAYKYAAYDGLGAVQRRADTL